MANKHCDIQRHMGRKGGRGSKASTLYADRLEYPDGNIIQVSIQVVPVTVPGSGHLLKYSLFYGHKDGQGVRTVGYDNERSKGDHRRYGDREESYVFTTPEQLVQDFLQDIARVRGEWPVLPAAPATQENEDE